MFCERCGFELSDMVARFCSGCGNATRGEVNKGTLIARVKPPFQPLGEFAKVWLWTAAGIVLAIPVAWAFDATALAFSLVGLFFFGTIVLLNVVIFQSSAVRVFEKGLERDIPRSLDKSAFLPWDKLTEYRWDGDVLHYSWSEGGIVILQDGRWPSGWPLMFFPDALRIPNDQIERIQYFIVSASGRQPTGVARW